MTKKTLTFTGVPTFFGGCCAEASQGGTLGYNHPGYHLAIHLQDQQPYDADDDTWNIEIEGLSNLLSADDAWTECPPIKPALNFNRLCRHERLGVIILLPIPFPMDLPQSP